MADVKSGNQHNPDINNLLLCRLQEKGDVVNVSRDFAALKTNEQRVTFVYDLLQEMALLPKLKLDCKSNEKSCQFRQNGNEMFKKRKSKEALELYTQSITCAENKSQDLALAYANRSAVLFENGLYAECLNDINRALEGNYPDNLKPKLLSRLVKTKELLPTQNQVSFFTKTPEIDPKNQNVLIQCASDSINIHNSKTQGRHIVATRDIEPGEILAIEKPAYQLLTEEFFVHCHHCLKLCFNLVPCERCTQALYCSKNCQNMANLYHEFECPILLTVKSMFNHKLKIMPLKIALSERNRYGALDKCVLRDGEVYRSDRYNEIHNLVANTQSRTVPDLFHKAVVAAALFHLVKTFTDFIDVKDSSTLENEFKEVLLLHMQTGPCNFHEITENKSSDKTLEQKEIGAGAYSFLSLFNHSCYPNTTRYSYGPTQIVVAIKSIKKGEECSDNYGYLHALTNKQDRKLSLKNQYFFDCNCLACEKNYPLLDKLPVLDGCTEVISHEDMNFLQNNNLKETERIKEMALKKIKHYEKFQPNYNLGAWQEVLKQCYFVFRNINTPI